MWSWARQLLARRTQPLATIIVVNVVVIMGSKLLWTVVCCTLPALVCMSSVRPPVESAPSVISNLSTKAVCTTQDQHTLDPIRAHAPDAAHLLLWQRSSVLHTGHAGLDVHDCPWEACLPCSEDETLAMPLINCH